MYFGESYDTLDADTVLSSRLEGASQQNRGNVPDVSYSASVLQNDSRVLATKLDGQCCKRFRGGRRYFVSDISTADERYMLNGWVTCQVVGDVRKAYDGLKEIWTVAARSQCAADDIRKVHAAPAYLLVRLDDNSISGEESRNDR